MCCSSDCSCRLTTVCGCQILTAANVLLSAGTETHPQAHVSVLRAVQYSTVLYIREERWVCGCQILTARQRAHWRRHTDTPTENTVSCASTRCDNMKLHWIQLACMPDRCIPARVNNRVMLTVEIVDMATVEIVVMPTVEIVASAGASSL